MPAEGLPIIMIAAADTGTSSDKTCIVTIEASDATAFTTKYTVATFPTLSYADTAVKKYVMRVATQHTYLRSVCTVAGSNGTFSRDIEIYVGTGEIDQ
jgi:hypothetical protein